MTAQYRFIEPLDVLFLRSNRLFGAAGSHGEALVPPWPSVAGGALRSRMMADDPALDAALLQDPERFRLVAFHLARRLGDGRIETLHALPADLVVQAGMTGDGALTLLAMRPQPTAAGLQSSAPLPMLPVLRQTERRKAESGFWLSEAGWLRYLQGLLPAPDQLVHASELWDIDTRIGIGLDATARRADDGKLFTSQAIAFRQHMGFLAGAVTDNLPADGLLRFGGDGRGARIGAAAPPAIDVFAPETGGRFKLVLTTPGIFSRGWLPPGLDGENRLQLSGDTSARLASAAIGRAAVISGWDLAGHRPKPAQRVVPAGSVYWFDDFQGDPQALRKLSATGLWSLPGQNDDAMRRTEGFNQCVTGAWID